MPHVGSAVRKHIMVSDIRLLVIPDCPHAAPAANLLAEVLAEEGLGHPKVNVMTIDSDEQAREQGFIGSPSFFVDGIDLFPVGGARPAVACRTYATSSGLKGLPDRVTLAAAVRAQFSA